MAISCVIGLAVCLNFAGERFHADELIEAFDTCEMVRQLSPDQFDGSSGYGIAALEGLAALGFSVDWTKPGARRKRAGMMLCAQIEAAANVKANWS